MRRLASKIKRKLQRTCVVARDLLIPYDTVVVRGIPVRVRRETLDKGVAEVSLGGEFDALPALLPRPRFNFIIDAGGYIGTAAIALSKLFPASSVVTLEPSEANFAVLKKNVRCFPQIIPLNKALAGTVRHSMLRARSTGQLGYTLVEKPLDCPIATPLHTCTTTTVAEILRQYGHAGGVDVLKLDIEGGEKEVLEGASEWIDKVDLIIVELHDRITSGCTTAFEAAASGMCRSTSWEKQIAYRSL